MDIFDFLIDKGNLTIWSYINSKKFFLPLINLLKIKDIPEVQIKLLSLIQKWGIKFEEQKNIISNFTDIYNRLKNNGVEFPEYRGNDYNKYLSIKEEEKNNMDENNEINNNKDNINIYNNNEDDTFYYIEYLRNILKEENFQHKYRRLVAFLLKMNENIKIANEYIDLKEMDKLTDIINTLTEGNTTLKDTIIGGRLKDAKLMEYALATNEDIKNTISREEDLKKGISDIDKFISSFEKNDLISRNNKNNLYENNFDKF